MFCVTGYVVIETRKRWDRHWRGKRHICGRPGLPSYMMHFDVDTHNTIAFLCRVLTLFFIFPSMIFIYVWESGNSTTRMQNSKLSRFPLSEEVHMFIEIWYLNYNYAIEIFFLFGNQMQWCRVINKQKICIFFDGAVVYYTLYVVHIVFKVWDVTYHL